MIGWKNGKFDFNCLEPQAVFSYLEDKGWKEEKKIDTRASILTTAKNDKQYSVLLPLEKDLPDFASRMYDVLRVLEVVENRPQAEIIKGLINVDKIAKEKQREILIIKFKSQYNQELPASKMGKMLMSLQKFFAAVGQSETAINSDNGRSPKRVLKKIKLSVLESGDFGIKLGLPPDNDSSNDSEIPLAERVAATFLELVKSSGNSDKEPLKQLLLKLERKAVSSYGKLLVVLKGLKADINVEWGSVNAEAGGRGSLSKTDIQKAIKYVKFWQEQQHQIITVKGKLLGANLTQNFVKIEEVETGKNYVGKLSEELLKEGNFDLTIGRVYSAKFEELTSINPATGTEKTQRTVMELAYFKE
jgi:hypothetical protein